MNLNVLSPGETVLLDDATQLLVFEDLVASQIDPGMSESQQQSWAGRVMLKDIIRPPKFNGAISGISLAVMADPYDRLFDARARGWSFMQGKDSGKPHSRVSDESTINGFWGFTFIADAVSSGRGVIGQIRAEIWYGPVPPQKVSNFYTTVGGEERLYSSQYKAVSVYGGRSVQRYITRPKLETEKFEYLDANSRRIGFRVLANALKHPMRG